MSKTYLIGITQDQKENIKSLTDPIWNFVDGLIFVDHGSTDGTRELLEERKGCGKIIDEEWVNSHDYSMNHLLLKGGLENGDWCIFRDSMERFNEEWASKIQDFVDQLRIRWIRTVYNYGKIFMFQYNDSMFFTGSPHFGLQGAQAHSVDLKDLYNEDKKEHTWRIRDGEEGGRPIDNKIDHEAKYAWVYGRSNHLLLGYENKLEQYERAEIIRQHMRDNARTAGFEMTVEGLKDFLSFLLDKEKDSFKSFINSHRVWRNFYRFHFLKANFAEIEKTEEDWKYE